MLDDLIDRFLLEGREGNVLYTGDFRLSRQDFIDFEHLKAGTKSVSSGAMLLCNVTYYNHRLHSLMITVMICSCLPVLLIFIFCWMLSVALKRLAIVVICRSSVYLSSVTWVYCEEIAEARIMQFFIKEQLNTWTICLVSLTTIQVEPWNKIVGLTCIWIFLSTSESCIDSHIYNKS